MLYKVFDFASKEVAAVMVPRPDVVAISADMAPEEALATVVDSPYTRYPVYRNSLDEIIGILHVRDLFAAMHDLGLAAVRLETIARPAFVVPETKDLAALLADFRREKQHMAIVVDEYGVVEGIVTLEDLIEEIVGEIEDEFDLPGHVGRAPRRDARPDRRLVHDRRLQRGVRDRARAGRLPHDGGPRVRRARARAGGRGRGRRGRAQPDGAARSRARGSRSSRSSSGRRQAEAAGAERRPEAAVGLRERSSLR